MEDTTPRVKQLVREIAMSRSAGERILMCAEMYDEAKEFARIGMPEGLSHEEQEIFLFRRIHGITPEESVRCE